MRLGELRQHPPRPGKAPRRGRAARRCGRGPDRHDRAVAGDRALPPVGRPDLAAAAARRCRPRRVRPARGRERAGFDQKIRQTSVGPTTAMPSRRTGARWRGGACRRDARPRPAARSPVKPRQSRLRSRGRSDLPTNISRSQPAPQPPAGISQPADRAARRRDGVERRIGEALRRS